MTDGTRPLLALGEVRHRRLRPVVHAFAYPSCMLLLPMRHLRRHADPALARNRFGWLAFHDRDHGDGGPDALAWIEALLAREGVGDADGEIWLHTHPRVLGYAFKPVSFWYCHRADGTLRAVVAEVHNTFGQRHCYLLDGPDLAWGREQRARKVLHVSPFCEVQGGYRFRVLRGAAHCLAVIDYDDEHGPLLHTRVGARLEALTPASARRAFWSMPLMSQAVMLRIHWQALRLWARRVPFFGLPDPPPTTTTR